MTNKEKITNYLNELYPSPQCELNYTKDYELLLAIVMSAQTTDKRVNSVNQILFQKYPSLFELNNAPQEDIEKIIKPIGTYKKKAEYIKKITTILSNDHIIKIPNNREYLKNLPGVGRKTINVFLSVIYNEPAIAVDTHVERVSKRLYLADPKDTPREVEEKLMKAFPKTIWSKLHHQLVFFGRYQCKSQKPLCQNCKLKNNCRYQKEKNNEVQKNIHRNNK